MSHSWDEIKKIIEQVELDRLEKEYSAKSLKAGLILIQPNFFDKYQWFLELFGELSIGLSVGITTLIFNFLVFTWLLHVEF